MTWQRDKVVDSHTIEVFASEDNRYPIQDDVDIPQGYDTSEVVVLPVNRDTIFVYWEITEGFLRQWQRQHLLGANLILVAFELSQGQARHIATLDVSTLSGKRYISCQTSFNPTVAIIGAFKGETFYDMLVSRTIHYPAHRLEGISIDSIIKSCFIRNGSAPGQPDTGRQQPPAPNDTGRQQPPEPCEETETWEYTFSGSNVEGQFKEGI
ncbi:MAG: DUF4912 domain-containing protein [Nitrospirae bacterium]|nr:DUF4912 domain-containing protein [Nitrospirota bacterium]